jgi:glycosyltransferase involved in cell wall biosynthesis
MSEPLVSVVIPVHNGQRFLAEAIDSVLAQGYPHREVVVVDDGSTDGSAAIARTRPVRYQRQPNQGVAAARNAGLAAAQGDLIAFLDQDDVWLPHKLEAQVSFLLQHRSVDGVISPVEIAVEPGATPLSWFEPESGMDVQRVALLGALLAWRSSVDRVGGFDTRYEIASDTDWIMRARDARLVLRTALGICMRYRMHEHNSSRREDVLNAEVRAVYRASVARKREARLRSTG